MNKRWIPIVAVVTLLCAVVAPAQMVGTPSKHAGRGAALADYLQLTPEQIRTWEQVRNDKATDMKPFAQDARDLGKQLHAAMNATPPDPATVGKLSLELRSLRDQVRAMRDASTAKFVATLTPEQKVKFDAFQAAVKSLKGRRQAARGPA